MSKEYWFVILAGILYGVITVGGQFFVDLGLSLFEISVYRPLLVSLILLPVLLIKRGLLIKKEMILFFAVYGLIGGMLELFMFAGIALGVPVAVVALLLYTQPIWTVIIGNLTFGERITLRKVAAVFIGISGIFFLLRSWSVESVDSFTGVICALISGILLSLWVIWGRKSAVKKHHYVTTSFGWSAFAFVWLLLLQPIAAFLIPEPVLTRLSVDFPSEYWLYFIIFALLGGVIPHLLFYRGLEEISASVAGIILLLEPVSAVVLAAIFFSQPVGPYIVVGGILILLSNYFVISEGANSGRIEVSSS